MDEDGDVLPPGQAGEIVCGRDNSPEFTYHGDDAKRRKIRARPAGRDRRRRISTMTASFICQAVPAT